MSRTIRADDDLLVTPAMRLRLRAEGEFDDGPGEWWALLHRSSGLVVPAKSSAVVLAPREDQQMFARDMVSALNKHLHHDGKWVVAFTHPSATHPIDLALGMSTGHWGRFIFMWVDQDGDVQFTIENDEPIDLILCAGPDHWMEQAEAGWNHWRQSRAALDGAPTFKRAQGERRPSADLPPRPVVLN